MKKDEKWTDLQFKFIKVMLHNDIEAENKHQIEKWGIQTHNIFEWMAYTTEELGELSKAISEYVYRDGYLADIYKEAIQTATLSLKIAEMAHGRLYRQNVFG